MLASGRTPREILSRTSDLRKFESDADSHRSSPRKRRTHHRPRRVGIRGGQHRVIGLCSTSDSSVSASPARSSTRPSFAPSRVSVSPPSSSAAAAVHRTRTTRTLTSCRAWMSCSRGPSTKSTVRVCNSSTLGGGASDPHYADVDFVPSVDELLTRTVDLVVIATPNTSHHPIAQQCLLAGRHVVIDKPFAPTLAEAQALVALAKTQR